MRKNTKADSRTAIRGKGWKKPSSIATEKYEIISKAILKCLTATPITYSELLRLVKAQVRHFDGSIPWYTLSCLRELEARGQVTRHRKPVLYSKT